MTGTYFSRIFIAVLHANRVIPGFICYRCHLCHAFFRIRKRIKETFLARFLRMLPSTRVLDAFSTALSTHNPQINARFFHLHICHCHCCCAPSFGSNVVVHFSFRFFPFFSFAFMIIAVIQFSAACAIRFHLFAIEIFMWCVTIAHCAVQMCFVLIRSIRCSCFWAKLFPLLLLRKREREEEIHVCFCEVI